MIYVRFTVGGIGSFSGMSEDTVKGMLDQRGVSFQFITKQEYESEMEKANGPL